MKFNYFKRGYTLAEIMIVLLVLTIIFAAFAPIFTKRSMTSNRGKYAVWGHVEQDELNAYTYPGDADKHGQMFFGTSPMTLEAIENEFLPLSKIVIRSSTLDNKFQRHIQFRYGRTSVTDGGKFAGTWSVLNNNILLGAGFNNIDKKLTIPFSSLEIEGMDPTTGARNNVAVGYDALNNLLNAKNNVAIGYSALNKLSYDVDGISVAGITSISNSGSKNVALGFMSGNKLTNAKNNVMIGSYAGGDVTSSHNNTLIGYQAGYKSSSSYNTYIGYQAGFNGGGDDNLAVGPYALKNLTSGSNNVAIGAHTLKNLKSGSNNVALGYNACSELVNSSNKTCIGYNAGPHAGTTAAPVTKAIDGNDTTMRTYIGSKPFYYGGDAILEIHNLSTVSPGIQAHLYSHLSNTTTVINGNLIVKGRPYFTVGNTLQHFHDGTYLYSATEGITIYGYKSLSDANYGHCSSGVKSYSFGSKCIQFNTSTSDRRLKNITTKNIAGLKEINKLKIYNFTFKNDPDKIPQIGVMAQDLQKVFPNSVFKDDNGYLKIKWDEMFYAAINAIKELDRKIIALVNRTTKVETQISKLEKENILLKSQVDNLTIRVNKLKAQ